MTDLAAIRARLEGATPGPWRTGWENEHGAGCTGPGTAAFIDPKASLPVVSAVDRFKQSPDPRHWYGEVVAKTATDADADFIAHARTDVADLLAAVEAARRERDDEREICGRAVARLRAELADVQAQVDTLRAALEQIASMTGLEHWTWCRDVARAALAATDQGAGA